MAYNDLPPLGQTTKSASLPVTIASDQDVLATSAKQDTIIGHVDGIETAIASTNTKLDTIIDDVDGLETSNTAIQTGVELLDDTVATLGTTTYTEATSKGLVIGAVRRDANTTLVNTTNEVAPLQVNATGELKTAVIQPLPAGTNNIGDVDVLSLVPGTGATSLGKARDSAIGATDTGVANLMVRRDSPTAETPAAGDYVVPQVSSNGAQYVVPIVYAGAGGWSAYKSLDLDESEEEIKASAGKIGWIHCMNMSASVRYLKLYNATAASVTVGTTTPVLTFPIPTLATTNGAGFTISFGDAGVQFSTAICAAATTGLADNDTGAPGANEVVLNVGYL